MTEPHRMLSWHRSSKCADTTCAEIASDGRNIYVRDGKLPDGAVLRFTRTEWEAFRDGVKLGDFDVI
jgi:hypothetical protein